MASHKELAVRRAIAFLKSAQSELREVEANKAADYVGRALKSARSFWNKQIVAQHIRAKHNSL